MTRLTPLFLIAAFAGCGPQDGPGPDPSNADAVRLLAYNIHHGEGMDEVTDLNRIADFINALEPDLVTLQEVDSVTERTGQIDQAAALGELTGMYFAFGRFMPYQGGAYGMAILSRWPIAEETNWRLADGTEPRTALGVRVAVPGTGEELMLVGIHFYETEEERLAQARDLEAYLAEETAPVILAGDFNSTPGSAVMDHLAARWRILDKGEDAYTFSSFDPVREIDFVLLRPAHRFDVVEHHPLDEPVISDHRPVWTEFTVRPR